MKKNLWKIGLASMVLGVSVGVCGCEKELEEQVETLWSFDEYDSTNESLYEQLVGLEHNTRIPPELTIDYDNKEMAKYWNVGDALAWEMEKHIEDKEKIYHVILQYFDKTDSSHDGTITQEIVDIINEQYDRDFKLEDWIEVEAIDGFHYYYIFTAEEILDLSDFGIICRYVGSGEGNIDDVDFVTEEGIATFFELYGDGIIQHKDGMKIYY